MNNDELMHYGVRGMKWGVRRASKAALNAKTSKQYNSAIKTLDSHRAKSVKKLKKLERNAPKLEKRARRAIEETDVRAAQLKSDAARYQVKSQQRFLATNASRARNARRAARLYRSATSLEAASARHKADLAINKYMQEEFRKGISDIDSAKIEAGKRYMKLF